MNDWNGGNLGVGDALGHKHDTDSEAGNEVVQQPFGIVPGQPLDNGNLFDEVLSRGRWDAASNRASPALDPVVVGIRTITCDSIFLSL